MGMHMGMKCIKYLLFVFNLIFVVAGITLIVVGAIVEHFYRNYFNFLVSTNMISVSAVVITIGSVIFVVGFFGCCGAMKEDRCMIMTFSILVSFIFVIEVGVSIAAYVLRGEVERNIEREVQLSMNKYNEAHVGVMKTWDVVQHDYKCCGARDYRDWENTYFFDESDGVPDSCCKQITGRCGRGVFSDESKLDDIHQKGCFEELKTDFRDNVTLLVVVAFSISFIELIGVLFACCLTWSIRHQYETVQDKILVRLFQDDIKMNSSSKKPRRMETVVSDHSLGSSLNIWPKALMHLFNIHNP